MKKTIVQILPALEYGGVERGTLEVAAELVRKKHRSIVISGSGRLVPQLIKEGSEHINLPVGEKSFFCFKFIPILQTIFEERKVDIVHARSRLPAWLSFLALKKIKKQNKPFFVTTVHGPYSINRYSSIMTKGDHVIAISNYIKKYITDNYTCVNKKNITVIHRGIDKNKFPFGFLPTDDWLIDWDKNKYLSDKKFIITLPARITRWKGHIDFIKIVTKLHNLGLNVHGLFVGGVDNKKENYFFELKKLILKLNMQENFTFLGHRDDIREIMAKSNIVLSLAKVPEAFGRTALEALSIGVPVVAYNHGGAAEVLSKLFPEGKVSPHDVNGVVSKIEIFYKNTPRVKNINIFTLDKMLEKTLAVYTSLTDD